MSSYSNAKSHPNGHSWLTTALSAVQLKYANLDSGYLFIAVAAAGFLALMV